MEESQRFCLEPALLVEEGRGAEEGARRGGKEGLAGGLCCGTRGTGGSDCGLDHPTTRIAQLSVGDKHHSTCYRTSSTIVPAIAPSHLPPLRARRHCRLLTRNSQELAPAAILAATAHSIVSPTSCPLLALCCCARGGSRGKPTVVFSSRFCHPAVKLRGRLLASQQLRLRLALHHLFLAIRVDIHPAELALESLASVPSQYL